MRPIDRCQREVQRRRRWCALRAGTPDLALLASAPPFRPPDAETGTGDDRVPGVWPGPDERPEIAHPARDWLATLRLVAAGSGITTVPAARLVDAPRTAAAHG